MTRGAWAVVAVAGGLLIYYELSNSLAAQDGTTTSPSSADDAGSLLGPIDQVIKDLGKPVDWITDPATMDGIPTPLFPARPNPESDDGDSTSDDSTDEDYDEG